MQRSVIFSLSMVVCVFPVLVHCQENDDTTLVMVNVLFRHGDRTPEELTKYPNDPHINETYYPFGIGQLTNVGKRRMYDLGKKLRHRYQNFLDEVYTPDILHARSSEYDRAKASLMLVLNGLFPMSEAIKWHDNMHWQPIPFNYVRKEEDKDFLNVLTREFRSSLNDMYKTDEYQASIQNYTHLMKYVQKHAGMPVNSLFSLGVVALGLNSQDEYGLKLPAWTVPIYPCPMVDIIPMIYLEITSRTQLVQKCIGGMLKTIVKDTEAKIDGLLPNSRKIHLHSGHDINCACLLKLLGFTHLFESRPPPFAAYMIFELHKIENEYGFKIFYDDYSQSEPRLLRIPKCGSFCKIDKFNKLFAEYLPN